MATTPGRTASDDFANEPGLSRLWAGVHFLASIPAGQAIGAPSGADEGRRPDATAVETFSKDLRRQRPGGYSTSADWHCRGASRN